MAEQDLPPQPLFEVTGPLTAGFSQSVLQSTLNGAANTVGQLALKIIQYIQGVLADAVNTGQAIALKAVSPIASGINQATALAEQLGTQATNQIGTGITAATAACASGCSQEQGARYNQYQYNILQDFDVPASVFVENRDYPISKTFANLCFRAGWDSYYDAVAYKEKMQGSPPPAGCAKPGGPATQPGGGPILPPDVPPCPGAPWQVWILVNPTTQQPVGCTVTCKGDPQPANSIPNGNPISDPVILAQVLSGPSCKPGVLPQADWFGGCLQNTIVTWEGASNAPPGAGGVVGPYADQASAAAAASQANPQCTVSITPPPPPPPCDCNVTINWPACIMIDLCDWTKFERSLKKALCDWYAECVCKLDNQTSYQLDDCDGTLKTALDTWLGGVGRVINQPPDGIVAEAQGLAGAVGYAGGGNGAVIPPA